MLPKGLCHEISKLAITAPLLTCDAKAYSKDSMKHI